MLCGTQAIPAAASSELSESVDNAISFNPQIEITDTCIQVPELSAENLEALRTIKETQNLNGQEIQMYTEQQSTVVDRGNIAIGN